MPKVKEVKNALGAICSSGLPGVSPWVVRTVVEAVEYHEIPTQTTSVDTLWELMKDRTFSSVWGGSMSMEDFSLHVARVWTAKLRYPVIVLSDTDRVLDGYHRVMKAHLNGVKTLKTVNISVAQIQEYINYRRSVSCPK